MSSNLYEIYRANTMQLAKTLVIKSEGSAEALNRGLVEYQFDVDPTRPETWMYYLNLAGEYHPVNRMMTIMSLDTLEIIDFTKANLLEHRTTAREYTYGSTYYDELVRRYPDQTALIRGIINPVDLNAAIAAPDFEILYYDKDLVEPWEENLIPELQKWIGAFKRKYYHADFTLVEDLYLASALAQMHLAIPLAIMLIRQKNCRTNYVHSFHLWSYLASHNYLDDYREFLTREQAMWLYRDIRWIDHNNGKTETFHYLIEHSMTNRGFPIGQYGMIADAAELPQSLYTDAEMKFTPLNFLVEQEITHDNKTVLEILEKEQPLARDNPENLHQAEHDINFKFTRGLMGEIPSKVLESEVTDIALFTPVRLIDTLYNHWILLACKGWYTSMITVQNPRSGENMVMSVKDAWVAFSYCLNRAYGIDLKYVVPADAWDVIRIKQPSYAELRAMAEPHLISDYLIRTSIDQMPQLRKIVSTESFYNKAVEIRAAQLAHRELYSLREHHVARGRMEAICKHQFETRRCWFAPEGTLMSEFFKARNWDLMDLDREVYLDMATAILTTATGQDLFYEKSLQEIHAAMLRLLLQLSSYSIHALQTINTSPAIVNDWRVIRVGDVGIFGNANIRHPWLPAHVKRWSAHGSAAIDYELAEQGSQYTAWIRSNACIYQDVGLDVKLTGRVSLRIRGEGPYVSIRSARPRSLVDYLDKPDLNGLLDWEFINEGGSTLNRTELSGLVEKDTDTARGNQK